jgi:GH24 family phage-related lysozyme (muramidase)
MNREQVLARLMNFEGAVPHMYRCTGGDVTVGMGHAITTSDEAVKLDWQIDGQAATPAEVIADFGKVAAAPKGNLAKFYEAFSNCRLSTEYINSLAAKDIDAFESGLIKAFPRWDSYPEPAQEALFDMGFNLGIGGLEKFVKLRAAIDAEDWATAALESHRQGISEARNQAIAALFRQAHMA